MTTKSDPSRIGDLTRRLRELERQTDTAERQERQLQQKIQRLQQQIAKGDSNPDTPVKLQDAMQEWQNIVKLIEDFLRLRKELNGQIGQRIGS